MQTPLAYSIANAIRCDGPSFIDDHNPHKEEKRKLLAINLCTRGEDSWFFPGGYTCDQCKNPLYLDDQGRLHLTTASKGQNLSPQENRKLLRGDVIRQRCIFENEEVNRSVSIEDFLAQHP